MSPVPPAFDPDLNPADIEGLADFYRHLATAELDGYCALYARIARAMATDAEALGWVVRLAPAPKIVPVLLFAAVHHLVLAEPHAADVAPLAAAYAGDGSDPWPPFRAVLAARREQVAATMVRRTIQTNEVGRTSVLLAAFTAVHRGTGRPLALVEIGASAGLNLLPDRFAHDFGDGRIAGDARSPVRLRCDPIGPLRPPVDGVPPIASRIGLDLAPIDVTDTDACRWLEACIWPGVPDRVERLRAALVLARADPPTVVRGDAAVDLVALLDAVPGDTLPCVVSTWALAYFGRPERARFGETLATVARDRDLACVTAEYPGVAPWVPRPQRDPEGHEGQGATVLGITTWTGGEQHAVAAAWVQAHGRWIDWLDQATAESSPKRRAGRSGSFFRNEWLKPGQAGVDALPW